MRRGAPIVVLLAVVIAAAAAGEWHRAGPGYEWSFPRDHHAHPGYRTEWWYVTGHLAATGAAAPRFGYQFTLFRFGLAPEDPGFDSAWSARDVVMGHVAVTDLEAGGHVFSETLYRAAAGLGGFGAPGDSLVVWSRAPAGTPGRWTLRLSEDGGFAIEAADRGQSFAFALDLAPRRPLVFQGPGGYSRKDPRSDAGSLYYSLTRLATSGTLTIGGDTLRVAGTSWLDREIFSDQLADDQVGWDWLSLQLADGRDLMVYRLRDAAGATSAAQATLVAPDGEVVSLDAGAWRFTPGRTWRSDATGAAYPVAWRLAVPAADLDLMIEAAVDDQENVSRRLPGLYYWEGAVEARDARSGAAAGRGYLELTGYGDAGRLPM